MIQVRLSRYRTRELARFPLHWSILGSPSPSVLHISYPAPHAPLQAVLHISVISLHASCDFFLFKTIQHDNLRTPFLACLPGNHHGGKACRCTHVSIASLFIADMAPACRSAWGSRAPRGRHAWDTQVHELAFHAYPVLLSLSLCLCICLCLCLTWNLDSGSTTSLPPNTFLKACFLD